MGCTVREGEPKKLFKSTFSEVQSSRNVIVEPLTKQRVLIASPARYRSADTFGCGLGWLRGALAKCQMLFKKLICGYPLCPRGLF